MTENSLFIKLKSNYTGLFESLSSITEEQLSLDYEIDFEQQFQDDMSKLQESVNLLEKARAAHDEMTVRAALVYIKIFSQELSNFFESIENDTLFLSKALISSDMPDDYQVPEHYNFPRY